MARAIPTRPSRARVVVMAAAALVAWLGEVLHNRMELPELTLASPENAIPLLVSVALVAWWAATASHAAAAALGAWALLHFLVGGVLSVLPLPIWPFAPEQSLAHYAAHVVYACAQVPLMVLAWRSVQRSRRRNAT